MDAQVESIHRLTPRVKQFRLERTDGGTFDHEPGQHTRLHLDRDGEEVVRPYTPTSLPGTAQLTLAIKRYADGTASTHMHERDRGDVVAIEEPEGDLYLRDLGRDLAFLATGTGMTPTMAMLRQALREGTGEVELLLGEKTQADLLYRETLDALAAEHERFSVTYVLSEEDWAGRTGHVQAHLEDVLGDLAGRDYYLCGVPAMVVETKERLADRGVPDGQVYTEGWEEDEVADE